jgi:hypothetical protein
MTRQERFLGAKIAREVCLSYWTEKLRLEANSCSALAMYVQYLYQPATGCLPGRVFPDPGGDAIVVQSSESANKMGELPFACKRTGFSSMNLYMPIM